MRVCDVQPVLVKGVVAEREGSVGSVVRMAAVVVVSPAEDGVGVGPAVDGSTQGVDVPSSFPVGVLVAASENAVKKDLLFKKGISRVAPPITAPDNYRARGNTRAPEHKKDDQKAYRTPYA